MKIRLVTRKIPKTALVMATPGQSFSIWTRFLYRDTMYSYLDVLMKYITEYFSWQMLFGMTATFLKAKYLTESSQ